MQKGFINILIAIVVVMLLVGGAGYYVFQKKVALPTSQGNNATSTMDTLDWKTYRSYEYGFEFRYPKDLALELFATATPDQITMFGVDDPHFNSENKVGQEVRTEFRGVQFMIYQYSENNFKEMKEAIIGNGGRSSDGNEGGSITIHSQSGDIILWRLQGELAGPYDGAIFHNDNYIFVAYTYFTQEALIKNILSTFKFIEPQTSDCYYEQVQCIKAPCYPVLVCPESKQGTISGTMSIGPICPVEQYPPDPACEPTPEMYAARVVTLYLSDQTTAIAESVPDTSGNFIFHVKLGTYYLDVPKSQGGPGGANINPNPVTIGAGETKAVSIDIDTGIR